MARMSDILGNAKKQDMFRVAKNEKVPYRGKKKHGSQMTTQEKEYIFKKLKSVKKWIVSKHALERIEEKGINVTYKDVVSTIHNSKIIEYHVAKFDNKDDIRVLLRGNAIVNRNYNVHFVYSLTRGKVVSSWLNEVTDTHKTLDWRDYDEKLYIIKGA